MYVETALLDLQIPFMEHIRIFYTKLYILLSVESSTSRRNEVDFNCQFKLNGEKEYCPFLGALRMQTSDTNIMLK